MSDGLLIVARFLQYAAAALLFGLAAFRIYGVRGPVRPLERKLLTSAGAVLVCGALLGLAGQAAAMTGDGRAALDPTVWWDVATATQVGRAIGFRAAAGLVALLALKATRKARSPWYGSALIGALATASFAWSGHGAAGEGRAGLVLLLADITHLLAVALWLGALAGFGVALDTARRQPAHARGPLGEALEGFAGLGSLLVAAILATGLVNSWILVTPGQLPHLLGSTYGILLAAKIALFAAMLGCAALNRFRITPALRDGAGGVDPLKALRASLAVEAACGVTILLVVGVLGTLSPPAAG